MNKIINYILARLQEKSTWMGLAVLVGLFGKQISPVDIDLIANAGIAIAALAAVVLKEKGI